MTNPLETFGCRVRRHRERLGLSQEEFAKRAGVHRTYIGVVENARTNLSLLHVLRIAHALAIDPGDLVAGLPRPR